jgi:hypothetical protein
MTAFNIGPAGDTNLLLTDGTATAGSSPTIWASVRRHGTDVQMKRTI